MNPIKPTIKTEIIPLAAIIVSTIASFYFYAHFPESVPTHWDFQGEVNGWSPSWVAAFVFPAVAVGVYFLFLALPYLDPKKERYTQFSKVYHVFKGMIVVFMSLVYFAASLNGLGYNVPIQTYVPFLIGLMFIVLGNYMSKIKPNWFMGIRTPWTLSSEEVWNKTHRFGAKVFMFGGVVLMCMNVLPVGFRMPLFIVAVVTMSLGTVVYSFIIYKKEENLEKSLHSLEAGKKYGKNNQSTKPTD